MTNKELRKPRTDNDWSKHEIEVTKHDGVLIHHFKKPDTICGNVKFINCGGVLSVTGDYGNWIFCREFHPSKEGYVSGGYWCEKLRMASTQSASDFDSDLTRESLNEAIEKGAEEYGYSGDELEQMKEYYRGCLEYVEESKEIYQSHAYESLPSFTDHDSMITEHDLKPWLKCVFDAFNEICNRLEKESQTEEQAEAVH